MLSLSVLKNTTRPKKKIQRVGRGIGSRRGKTSCRGVKGDGCRRGYTRRFGYEGGQVPLYRKLPIRGFTRGRFDKPSFAISLGKIEAAFDAGETVNYESLRERGLVPRKLPGGIKILGSGELVKKVKIEAHAFSEGAKQKLDANKIQYQVIQA